MSGNRFLWHQVDVDRAKGRAECRCGRWWTTTGADMSLLDDLALRHIEGERAAVIERQKTPGKPDDLDALRARIASHKSAAAAGRERDIRHDRTEGETT